MLRLAGRFDAGDTTVMLDNHLLMPAVDVRYPRVQVAFYLGKLTFDLFDFALYASQDMHDQEPDDS
jgi:hypothetical protein